MASYFGSFFSNLASLSFLWRYWWFWLFCFSFAVAWAAWMTYIREYWYYISNKWTVYEIKIPADVQRGPRAMEQIFHVLHYLRYQPDIPFRDSNDYISGPRDQWWLGEFVLHTSLEITSHDGEIQFFIRVAERYRRTLEAAFYSEYPGVELKIVEDYISRLPATYDELKKNGYKLFGSEIRQSKPAIYPIRTYKDSEGREDWDRLDPIALAIEILAQVKPGETVWIQFLLRSANGDWKKEAEEEIQKKWDSWRARPPEPGVTFRFPDRKPGDQKIVEAMQEKLDKPAFQTVIRYVYVSPAKIFDYGFGRTTLRGIFDQYASGGPNTLNHNFTFITQAGWAYPPYLFERHRYDTRARRIFYNYRRRIMHGVFFAVGAGGSLNPFKHDISPKENTMLLSAEEMATLFHIPTFLVNTGPFVKRIEAKRIGAPAGIAIFGEEVEQKK